MKTVPDILGLGLNFRPIVMINTVLVMPGVSSLNEMNNITRVKIASWDEKKSRVSKLLSILEV